MRHVIRAFRKRGTSLALHSSPSGPILSSTLPRTSKCLECPGTAIQQIPKFSGHMYKG